MTRKSFLRKASLFTRGLAPVLALLDCFGCFNHPNVDPTHMVCQTDDNCLDGYVCVKAGDLRGICSKNLSAGLDGGEREVSASGDGGVSMDGTGALATDGLGAMDGQSWVDGLAPRSDSAIAIDLASILDSNQDNATDGSIGSDVVFPAFDVGGYVADATADAMRPDSPADRVIGSDVAPPALDVGGNVADAPVDAPVTGIPDAPVATPDVAAPGLKSTGATCGAGTDCSSGFCVDSVCCVGACAGSCQSCNVTGSEGTCLPVTNPNHRTACAGSGLCAGTCDGQHGDCRYPDGTQLCTQASCSAGTTTPAAGCDGKGGCSAPGAGVSCNGPCNAAGTACGQCTTDSDCASVAGSYCASGKCVPRKGIGISCTRAGECGGGNCVDGVCCGSACTGQCEYCNGSGICTPVSNNGAPVGSRTPCAGAGGTCGGVCDGTNRTSCSYAGVNTTCGGGETCSNGMYTPAAKCNGSGQCGTVTSTPCGAYQCAASGGKCLTVCGSGSDCASGYYCSNPGASGACVAKTGPGSSCSSASTCASSPFCASGHCCDTACAGDCETCTTGTCTKKPNTTICRAAGANSTCDPAEYCTGTSSTCPANQYAPQNTSCGPAAHCSGDGLTTATVCNDSGTCVPGTYSGCGNYVCDSATQACKQSCESPSDCISGKTCTGGVCTDPPQGSWKSGVIFAEEDIVPPQPDPPTGPCTPGDFVYQLLGSVPNGVQYQVHRDPANDNQCPSEGIWAYYLPGPPGTTATDTQPMRQCGTTSPVWDAAINVGYQCLDTTDDPTWYSAWRGYALGACLTRYTVLAREWLCQ